MRLVRLALLLFFATIALPAAHAAEPTIDEKISSIIDITGAGNEFMSLPLFTISVRGIAAEFEPEAQSRALEIIIEIAARDRAEKIRIYLGAFRDVYSDDEIDYIYDFYHSPIGQNALGKIKVFRAKLRSDLLKDDSSYDEKILLAIETDPELQRLRDQSKPRE